jgi:predicted Rossmann-fold nucleotide-binding protein
VDTGMISPGDLKLFHFVETAEEAWAVLEHYGFDAPATQTGEFADDV